ncbi:MAG: hypothetical protein EPN47_11890 [Acidobacteria bacterium]|nr:MAG: hypothetical protein EPN47_11890 [Acidobacteriota bacterium]
MQRQRVITYLASLAALFAVGLFLPVKLSAHCDGMDGPVVMAAQRALERGDVNTILIWVQKKDEGEVRQAFEKTLAVRKLGPEAKSLADMYFFETVVRLHRAGEGAPYTGLKPAGRDLGPAIPAADKALESGSVEQLVKLLTHSQQEGIRNHFKDTLAKRDFDKGDVEAGRTYVKAYVEFVHYVERLYESANGPVHGHYAESEEADMR